MALESSRGKLQLWFRPHSNRRSEPGDMSSQSPGTPTRGSFRIVSGLLFGSPGKKSHLNVASPRAAENIIWGKVVASPESRPW